MATTFDLILTGGTVVNHDGEGKRDVGVNAGRIAAIGYSSSAPEDVIVSVEKYLHVIELILTAIGVVALAIAALGIANALLAAVRERRREIGVMKAIGARDRDSGVIGADLPRRRQQARRHDADDDRDDRHEKYQRRGRCPSDR